MASKAAIIAIGGCLLFGGGLWYWATHARVSPQTVDDVAGRITNTAAGDAAKAALMTDEERRAYIREHVVASDIEVGADTKEGENGETMPVPGLLRARGRVTNNGTRPVTPVTLQLLLLGKDGAEVIGAYVEDVSGGKRLEPQATRDFQFTLPDKKEWGGTFRHGFK